MSITSEISRIQTAKADIKAAIENKGVTVHSNTKIDGYADLVDSIETGGTAPYIVNPLNGGTFGSPRQVGSVTHQYQINGASIVECGLSILPVLNYGFEYDGVHESYQCPCKRYIKNNVQLTITDSGLLTLNLTRNQSKVNEYEWITLEYAVALIKLDNGSILADYLYPYSSYSCFVKGTTITLASKENKPIEEITYNDNLLVWNFDESKYDSAKPLWIKKVQTTTWYYKLTFSDGTVLNVTGDYPKTHSLYSVDDGKFIHANELVGKKVYTLNGIQTLEKCEEIHEEVEFYNIITDYHMNLFAEGILTSTSLNNLYPIEKMTFIKEDREPVFDTSIFEDKWIKGLRLNEQPNDVTDYVDNVIRLAIDGNGFDNF